MHWSADRGAPQRIYPRAKHGFHLRTQSRTSPAPSARRDQGIHLTQQNEKYWGEQTEIQIRAASAWLAFARGKKDEALTLMNEAANRESATEKSAVTPGPIAPARELLGEMLLELNRPREALVQFQKNLEIEPRRYRSVAGAAKSASLIGDRAASRKYSAQMRELCGTRTRRLD